MGGQRDSGNRDRGTSVPYIIRRTSGEKLHEFITIYEGNAPQNQFVKEVRRVPQSVDSPAILIEVKTQTSTDYIAWNVSKDLVGSDEKNIKFSDAAFSIISTENGVTSWSETVKYRNEH